MGRGVAHLVNRSRARNQAGVVPKGPVAGTSLRENIRVERGSLLDRSDRILA